MNNILTTTKDMNNYLIAFIISKLNWKTYLSFAKVKYFIIKFYKKLLNYIGNN